MWLIGTVSHVPLPTLPPFFTSISTSLSTPLSTTPPPTVPSAPTRFSVTTHNDTTLVVMFSPPMEVNGILRLFQIQYQLFEMGSEVQTVNVTVEEGKTAYDILLSNLAAFMMYSIRVRAATGAGFGPFTPSVNHSTLEAGMCMHVCVRACVQ